ncbi:chromate transporter [Wohlfahrtiimonas populi]|uniref:chromate transporter n=1 Tax=Wohlfahrtiimonas populi TaxID=1940240 RepID=UPI001E5443BC|nr:chromate transporter [Wohlfahrtiimonas populi]
MSQSISAWQVFLIFLKLGLTSFGGPVAHLGYFREEFVSKRRWLSDAQYADLVAICQFLPGPASSQVGMAIGLSQAGYKGAFSAWLGFTLPSAIFLIIFALGVAQYSDIATSGILHGLKIAAVAIVAQTIWGMAKNLCPDKARITIMVITTCFVLAVPSAIGQVLAIIISGFVGWKLFQPNLDDTHQVLNVPISKKSGGIWLLMFFVLLIILPMIVWIWPNTTAIMFDDFYRAGSLVFGGGHVVLPLLQAEVVETGRVSNDLFLAGYGATQIVPGPLFTFAAFLGASMNEFPNGWVGGMIALVAIFLPSFLLVVGALPFWESLRHHAQTKAALIGINAAVVGLLLAAFYQPIWINTIFNATDFSLALIAFVALMYWKLPIWLVVIASGMVGWLLHSPFILESF